ncbi:hypothetical protein, partial [Desulfoluna sp.]|uniref:hypothetical protein n=1 Tax=Desulfoluna sp. TaxID=2045199 RepID=UPI00262C5CE8
MNKKPLPDRGQEPPFLSQHLPRRTGLSPAAWILGCLLLLLIPLQAGAVEPKPVLSFGVVPQQSATRLA